MSKPDRKGRKAAGWAVTVAGLGNIGSQTVSSMARISEVGRFILVDPDVFEAKNVATQAIGPEAVGCPKVVAVAEMLRRIRPDLVVETFQDRVERVPWGLLRSDLFLGCLDTKAARMGMSRIARRLGVDSIDAGVGGPELRVRVSTYPARGEVCLECGWGRGDYANLEVAHACQGGEVRGAATNSPAYLGQLAAALQVMEGHRLLSGGEPEEERSQAFELLMDGRSRRYYRSAFRRNPACRFTHGIARAEVIHAHPRELTLGSILTKGSCLEVEGDVFVRQMVCPGCGARTAALLRRRSLRLAGKICAACGTAMEPLGFSMRDQLEASALEGNEGEVTLEAAGFLPGDMFRIFMPEPFTPGRVAVYYELETKPGME